METPANNQAVIYRHTYDDGGNASGGEFGPGFDLKTIGEITQGKPELDLGCHDGTANCSGTEAGFGFNQLNVDRLAGRKGLECPESKPKCRSHHCGQKLSKS